MRRLYVLELSYWYLDDFIAYSYYGQKGNPTGGEFIIFDTHEKAVDFAQRFYVPDDLYIVSYLYTAEISESDILDISGVSSMVEFDRIIKIMSNSEPTALGGPSGFWNEGLEELAVFITDNGTELDVDIPNNPMLP